MARKPRNIIPEVPNHIVTRGNNRRVLFSYPCDYQQFIWLLNRGLERNECVLHGACLMRNHMHLLLTPPTVAAASNCVKDVFQRYAQLRNQQRNASGKLFEQRYYSKPIESEPQLAVTMVYIDANPLRAGLVEEPLRYRWSSYGAHVGLSDSRGFARDMVRPSPWYSRLGRSSAQRAARYEEWFQHYVEAGVRPAHADEFEHLEAWSTQPYEHRLRRPDESRASEPKTTFGHTAVEQL